MYRITITNQDTLKEIGDIAPNLNEVRRYLAGRVAEIQTDLPKYATTLAGMPKFGLPGGQKVIVTIEKVR